MSKNTDRYDPGMARPYRDGAELATEPAPRRRDAQDHDAVVVVGVWYPGAEAPLPLALIPGYEYRIRRFTPSEAKDPTRPPGWAIERRKAIQDAAPNP